VCDFVLQSVANRDAKCAASCNIECLEQSVTATKVLPIKESLLELVEEVESGVNIDKVLLFESRAIATGTSETATGTLVSGEAVSDIIYLSDGKIYTKVVSIPFNEEMDFSGKSDISAKIKSSRLVLTGEESNNILRIELTVTVNGYITESEESSCLKDVYSEEKMLNVETECIICKTFEKSIRFNQTLFTEAEIEEDMPPVKRVIATPVSRVNLANIIAGEGEVTAEGLVVTGVLYLSEDEAVNALQIELPYSLTMADSSIDKNDALKGEAIAANVTARSRGSIIEVNAQLIIKVSVYKPFTQTIITQIEEGEDKTASGSAISIYFADENDTLWSIAKAMNVAPSKLLELNPQLSEGNFGEAKRVVIYRPKVE
jgi:LysM repeat protein